MLKPIRSLLRAPCHSAAQCVLRLLAIPVATLLAAVALIVVPAHAADPVAQAIFSLNGKPAERNGSEKPTAMLSGKVLTLNVYGFMVPDGKNRLMALQIKNFAEKPGEHEVLATYSLRDLGMSDSANKEFQYSSKPGAFKLVVTDFKVLDPAGKLRYATMSGTFEGVLAANVYDPALKTKPLAQPLTVQKGSFTDVPVARFN